MGLYTGLPCTKCGKPFLDGDDVVVCPVCGAPHHRACYQEEGHCARLADHDQGDWRKPAGAPKQAVQVRVCQKCGGHNPADGSFCQYCGNRLEGVPRTVEEPVKTGAAPGVSGGSTSPEYAKEQYARYSQGQPKGKELLTPVGPVTPDEDFDGVSAREIAAYVGENAPYFITSFKVMKESGRSFSFNWAAFFFNYCYFFFRRMYKPALILLGIVAAVSALRMPYSLEYAKYYVSSYLNIPIAYDMALIEQLAGIARIGNMAQFAVMMTTAVFGNRIYYKHVIASIKRIRQSAPENVEPSAYFSVLERSGGNSFSTGVLAVVLSGVVMFIVAFLMAGSII